MLEKFRKDFKQGVDDIQMLWGMIFRALFIFSVGFFAYNWVDSHDIGDVPLGQLTLKAIIGRLLAIGIVIGCFAWFIKFPMREEGKKAHISSGHKAVIFYSAS